MSKIKKGILLEVVTVILWLIFAITLPNFKRYQDEEFNNMIQLISYSITFMASLVLLFGGYLIISGTIERSGMKRK